MRRFAALALVALLAACQTAQSPRPEAGGATPAALTVPAAQDIERSRGEAGRDEAIKAAVTRRVGELDRRATRAVTVEVWRGRVLLMGAVIKPEQRRKAEQAAAATEGVTTVLNELVLAEDKALDVFAADPAREDAVRRTLGIDSGTGTVVRVINGVAFLLGGAPSTEAAAAMKADATEVEGIKWVVSHLSAP
ncbi:MAG: BON domain-containing protein [Magnetospirillum sp.]|nr:BON domain-containing protein [Magnetospirillum sp.]